MVGVSCTCVYNQSGKCKHIAALIYYVNHEESLSKTDYEQQWGKPSQRQLVQQKYCKGKYFSEMFPPKKNSTVIQCNKVDVSELEGPSALKIILLEREKDKDSKAIRQLMSFMLETVEVKLQQEECAVFLNTFFGLNKNKLVYVKTQIISKEIEDFYKKEIVRSRKEIIQLCCDTIEQSKCNKWFQIRNLRISASKNVHEIKTRKKKPVEKLVIEMLYPKKINTPALRYGTENEPNAIKEYERLYSMCVKKSGVIICETQPWLCVSLDGIVVKDNEIIKIVEFKCPSSCEKVAIVDFEAKKCNVNYLQIVDSKVVLRTSSVYYTQCQIQLYVTGLTNCDLFLYSPIPNGSICISIDRNETFLRTVVLKCEDFYFQHYLPKLFEKSRKEKDVADHEKKNNTDTRCFTGSNIVNTNEE